MTQKNLKKNLNYKKHFGYWLSGLIDGDGYLGVSNKNYTSCEITVGLNELTILNIIKKTLSGKISLTTKANAYRWRLHDKQGMNTLVQYINGKCLLPSKKIQLENVCKILKIPFNCNASFSGNTYWVAGFFEAEGYFNVNKSTLQCSITISQKIPELLKNLKFFFGGNVYYDKSWNGFLYSCSNKTCLNKWFVYFSQFPLKSRKNIDLVRFKRIVFFKERKYHVSNNDIYKKRFFKLFNLFKARRYSPRYNILLSHPEVN